MTKIIDWMVANRDRRWVRVVALILYPIAWIIDEVRNRTERKVSVYTTDIHEDGVVRPYTVGGFVIRGKKAYSFSEIPWENVEGLIERLDAENDKMTLEVTRGAWWQEVPLSKWARKQLSFELKALKEENEEDE